MQVLAISTSLPGATPDKLQPLLREEALHAWHSYESGLIRQWYFRQDRPGAVLMLEVADLDEARRHIDELPLVKAKLIEFELIPLGPFKPIAALFAKPAEH